MYTEVSIIIPAFNKAAYLSDCLDSVLNQSFKSLEVICIDDASEDQSGEILRNYANRDSRLRVIKNSENLGPGLSRNIGIETAKGKFLRFVDADDLLPQKSIETLHVRATEDDVDLVKGSLATFCGDDSSTYQEVSTVPDKIRTNLSIEEHLWIPWWHTSYLISTDLIRKNNLRYPNLVHGEDPVFLASTLVNAKHLSFVGEIVYLYRRYQKSSGSYGSTFQHVVDYVTHAAMTKHLFIKHNPDCWYRGYGPFLLNSMQNVLDRCELDPTQKIFIGAELTKVWSDNALDL